MSEINSKISIEIPSEKSFGIVFAIIFLLISLYPLIHNKPFHFWALIFSIFFLCSAFIFSRILKVPNMLWFKFGLFLGSIIAPLVMVIVYFLTIFPIGLIMRLLGKDLLNLKLNENIKSYWIKRKDEMGTMKNQY